MTPKEIAVATAFTLSWMSASSGLILLNKYILSNLGFHYPLTLSRRGGGEPRPWPLLTPAPSLGMGFSSFASATLIHVIRSHKLEHRMTRDFWLTRVFPLGFVMARPRRRPAARGALRRVRPGGDAWVW